jgi:hypothetical protein
MEVDGSVGSLGIEVGSNASKTERFAALFSHGDLFFKKKSQTQANQANKWGASHASQAKVLEALEKTEKTSSEFREAEEDKGM